MKRKKTTFIMLALVVFVTAAAGYASKAQGSVTYGKAYTIGNILSDYQYFIQDNLTATSAGHCVGAVAVGGTLDTQNSVGDGQIAASYVKNIKRLSDFSQGSWITNSYKVEEFYYDTVDAGVPSWLSSRFTYNPDYINFNLAFSNIKTESDLYASQGTAKYSVSYGVLTINLDSTKDTYVTIPYSVIASASSIVISGLTSVQDFVDHKYVISITDVNIDDYIFSFYNIQFNGQSFSQKLKELANGSNGSQINLDGMKLIWNFPDATGTLTAQGLSGHIVAPQADVNVIGGNFEGGVIAKSVTKADAEGHYYLFNKVGSAPEIITATTATTTAATTAATTPATTAATTAGTTAATTAATTEATTAATTTAESTIEETSFNAVKTVIAIAIKDKDTNEKVGNLEVLVKNQTTGQEYRVNTDVEGMAIIEVNEGSYQISVANSNFSYGDGKPLYIASGGYENIKFSVSMSDVASAAPKTGEKPWIFVYFVISIISGTMVFIGRKKEKTKI